MWMHRASSLAISEIGSYVKGVKMDYDAISNAAIYEFGHGLAEGSVNKLKLFKRLCMEREA